VTHDVAGALVQVCLLIAGAIVLKALLARGG
jgi:hypothetical protein